MKWKNRGILLIKVIKLNHQQKLLFQIINLSRFERNFIQYVRKNHNLNLNKIKNMNLIHHFGTIRMKPAIDSSNILKYLDKLAKISYQLSLLAKIFSFSRYFYLLEPFSSPERVVIRKLAEILYHTNFNSYLPIDDDILFEEFKSSIGVAGNLEDSQNSLSS